MEYVWAAEEGLAIDFIPVEGDVSQEEELAVPHILEVLDLYLV